MQVFAVIRLLSAERDGAARDSDLPHILADAVVCADQAHGHREIQHNRLAVVPVAGEVRIAIRHANGLIRRHIRIGTPARQTEAKRAGHGRIRMERDGDVPVPRHIRRNRERQRARGEGFADAAAKVEVGQQRILILREGIRGDGGDDARDIGRAARAAEPLLPHGFDVLKA